MSTTRALSSFTLATLATADGPTMRETARSLKMDTRGMDTETVRASLAQYASDAPAAPAAPAALVASDAPAAPAAPRIGFLAAIAAMGAAAPTVAFPVLPPYDAPSFPAALLAARAASDRAVKARTPDATDERLASAFAEKLNGQGFQPFGPFRDPARRYPARSTRRAGDYYWTASTAAALTAAVRENS